MLRWPRIRFRSGGGAVWLISYADMVTLMLAFFIVLYTMSKIDNDKLMLLIGSLNQAFKAPAAGDGVPEGPVVKPDVLGDGSIVPGGTAAPAIVPPKGEGADTGTPDNLGQGQGKGGEGSGEGGTRAEQDIKEVVDTVRQIARQLNLSEQVSAKETSRGAVVSFAENADSVANVLPFESGSAALRGEFRRFLDLIAPVLAHCTNKIEIQGHTDRRPIRSAAYPSNWELSGARAGSVVRYLVSRHGLVPDQFVCTGFADTAPVDTGNNPRAWARNRRIEIVVTRHPIGSYDELTRADSSKDAIDITAPLGAKLVDSGIPDTPVLAKPAAGHESGPSDAAAHDH